jgi:hypothetical protein
LRPQNIPRLPKVASAPKPKYPPIPPKYAPLPPKYSPLQPVTNILKPIINRGAKFVELPFKIVKEILHPFKLIKYQREKEFVPPKLEKVLLTEYIVNPEAKQISDNLIRNPISFSQGVLDKAEITRLAGGPLNEKSTNDDLLHMLETAFVFYETNYFDDVLYKDKMQKSLRTNEGVIMSYVPNVINNPEYLKNKRAKRFASDSGNIEFWNINIFRSEYSNMVRDVEKMGIDLVLKTFNDYCLSIIQHEITHALEAVSYPMLYKENDHTKKFYDLYAAISGVKTSQNLANELAYLAVEKKDFPDEYFKRVRDTIIRNGLRDSVEDAEELAHLIYNEHKKRTDI